MTSFLNLEIKRARKAVSNWVTGESEIRRAFRHGVQVAQCSELDQCRCLGQR